ncbi:PREDICTED: endothelin-converting enzyme 1-like [Acropora digitifera]|uniref:endothelin-converting enzyme 1-like n=1 Tax=Acropora digitifera TaxID=70779 RepID=UPI00077AE08A|nr:PREDICTED: endothelin-converting enzyme 1-like [Acropora digitifera]
MDFFSKTKVLSLLLFALSTMILFSSTSARHLRKEHKIIRHGTKKKQNCNNTTKDHKVRCRDKLKLCKKQAELHNVKLGTIVAGSRPGRLHAKHEKTRGGTNKKYSNNFTTKDRETKCHHERTKCEMQAKVAKDLLKAMNHCADPCQDFFEYACGSWIKEHSIPESKSSWSQFQVLYKRNELVMKDLILDNKEAREKYKDNVAVMKGFDMFDSCMDKEGVERLGAKPLLDLIKRHGSWNVTDGNWTEESWDFMDTFVKIQKYLSIAPLFNMYVSADLKDSTKNIIVLDQSGLGISPEAFFKNTSYHRKVRKAYKKLMVDLAKLLGEKPNTEAMMMEIYNFEETLAKNFIPRKLRRDTSKLYKKMTIDDFIKASDISIDLMDFLKRMFIETGHEITGEEKVVSFGLQYVKNMSRIYNATSKRILANYMMWHVVLRFAPYLSSQFAVAFADYRKSVSGVAGEDPRWQDCLSSVDGSFGMPFGLLFVDKAFEGESKKSAEEMIHDIRHVFLANLDKVDWMDDVTKEKAKEKAEAIRENIGYPSFLTNKTALGMMYEGFEIRKDNYFQNIIESFKFYNLKNYEKLGKPVDKERWGMTPPTVNAYYSTIDNKIVFLSLGRQFNKEGNLAKWWSNKSIEAFKNKTACLVKQYSGYKFHGKNLKGSQTLGENIADNGGIKQAFQAYQNWKKRSRKGIPEPPLPGLEKFSNEQIFFLGFAQIWCSKFRDEAAISQINYGVHSPGKFRVIGSLSNFDEFSKAFGCKKGSPMNPDKKCSVW